MCVVYKTVSAFGACDSSTSSAFVRRILASAHQRSNKFLRKYQKLDSLAMNDEDILSYFSYDSQTNKTTCLTCQCVFSGFVKFNLKRHYKACSAKSMPSNLAECAIAQKVHSIKVTLTTRQIVEPCIRLVTVHGKAFAVLNSIAFRQLFEPVNQLIYSFPAIRKIINYAYNKFLISLFIFDLVCKLTEKLWFNIKSPKHS